MARLGGLRQPLRLPDGGTPADDETWWVACLCGECGHWHEVYLSNAQAAEWDVQLLCQADEIAHAADRLDHERMKVQTTAFVAALRHDLIDAADFT